MAENGVESSLPTPPPPPSEEVINNNMTFVNNTNTSIITTPSGKIVGKVKWFNSAKGFGFVTPLSSEVTADQEGGEANEEENGIPDIFVHQSSIYANGFRSLQEGEEIEFNIEGDESNGKTKAVDVTGPNGDFVQGAPKREYNNSSANNGSRGGGRNRRSDRRGGRRRQNRDGDNADHVNAEMNDGGAPAPSDADAGNNNTSSGLQVVVHNLSWSTDWRTLKEKFAACGKVVRADVASDNAGRSRGFGTVRFESAAEAQESIDVFHNSELDGRTVTVRLDRFA